MTVRCVTVQLQAPSGSDHLGAVTEGFFRVDGNMLTMTKPDGEPVDEKRFRHTLRPGDVAEAIARVFTKEIRLERLGMDETQASFARRLDYPQGGQI